MQLPRAFLKEQEFRAAVDRVVQSLAPDVVRVTTTLDYDWTDQPAAFFMVIVSDEAARHDRVHEVANRFSEAIDEQVEPHLEWGVWPFVNVRTQSEQAEIEQRSVA